MEIRIAKGFVRQARTTDGKPACMLLLVVEGTIPEGLGDETVFAGKIVFEAGSATLNVEAQVKTDHFAGLRADQILCKL